MSEVKYFRWTPDGMVEWMAHPDLCAVGVFVRHETFQRHVADELPACKVLAHDLYRRECETSRQLRDEVARLRGVLERIAKYGDNGICPYGCDTPHIAQAALTPQPAQGKALIDRMAHINDGCECRICKPAQGGA